MVTLHLLRTKTFKPEEGNPPGSENTTYRKNPFEPQGRRATPQAPDRPYDPSFRVTFAGSGVFEARTFFVAAWAAGDACLRSPR